MADKTQATPEPRRLRIGLAKRGANSTPGLRFKVGCSAETPSSSKKYNTAETPRVPPLLLKPCTTICRRPGLTRIRKDITKKRLEFIVSNEQQENNESMLNVQKSEIESETKSYQSRQRQITELEADIEMWRKAFVESIKDLQAFVSPGHTKQELLIQLGIPLEMLQYLDED